MKKTILSLLKSNVKLFNLNNFYKINPKYETPKSLNSSAILLFLKFKKINNINLKIINLININNP